MQSSFEIVELLVDTMIYADHLEVESFGCEIHLGSSLVWHVVDSGMMPWHQTFTKPGTYKIKVSARTFVAFIGRIII